MSQVADVHMRTAGGRGKPVGCAGATITLRPIRGDDRPFLYKVYASTREEEMALAGWEASRQEAFLKMQFDAQHTFYQERFPEAAYQVIMIDGEPGGRLYVDRRKDEIRLIDIALLPEYRGAGIGSRLMQEILDEARGAGKPVRIHVEQFNPARRLYERLGFSEIADKGVYVLMEWSPG